MALACPACITHLRHSKVSRKERKAIFLMWFLNERKIAESLPDQNWVLGVPIPRVSGSQ